MYVFSNIFSNYFSSPLESSHLSNTLTRNVYTLIQKNPCETRVPDPTKEFSKNIIENFSISEIFIIFVYQIKLNIMERFNQLAVWEGTILKDEEVSDFEKFFLEELKTRIKFLESVQTLPGQGGEGGRSDVFFKVHDEDLSAFALHRFGIQDPPRWWEDVLNNGGAVIYPQEILKKYPKTW